MIQIPRFCPVFGLQTGLLEVFFTEGALAVHEELGNINKAYTKMCAKIFSVLQFPLNDFYLKLHYLIALYMYE